MAEEPASKKAKIAEATEKNDAAAIIDVDAMDEIGDADDDAVPDADEDWYGPRTPDVQLRVSERKYASGVVVLDAADEAWFNGRAPALIADLEDALAALPILQKPPKDGDKGQTLRVEGALIAATVKLSPAPAPYLLLVADEGDDAPQGYRRLAHCGYAAECAVRPLAAASPPA